MNKITLGRITAKRGRYETRKRIREKMLIQFFAVMVLISTVAPSIEFYKLGKELDYRIEPVSAQTELSMKDWVLKELEKNGIDSYEAYAIIKCESNWSDVAINKNKDGSYDIGLWQLNEKWQPSPRACKLDYKCATEQAIKIIKKSGFRPWVCSKV